MKWRVRTRSAACWLVVPVSAAAALGFASCGAHESAELRGAQRLTGADAPDPTQHVAQSFEAHLNAYRDLDYAGLERELRAPRAPDTSPSFDPTAIRHFPLIAGKLQLTAEETAIYRKRGLVSVDPDRRHSMGSAYYQIYTLDLPVLITTDSILHAFHRSYDEVLKQLELGLFTHTIGDVLAAAHAEIAREAQNAPSSPALAETLGDLDLYVSVARNLLAGGGAAKDEPASDVPVPPDGVLLVPSAIGQDGRVRDLLSRVASLVLETRDSSPGTELYGGKRFIDYSQFRPRGHYTEHPQLRRYFRTMMWLGRADLGFHLTPPDAQGDVGANAARERRDAAAFVLILERSGTLARLSAMSAIIDFMVGRGDDVTISEVKAALDGARISALRELVDDAALGRALDGARLKAPRIRSQVLSSPLTGTRETRPSQVFQVFGQRFLIDSFALSKLVFDSIVYRGEKQTRMMPSGLDVIASFGNREAVALLKPQLEEHNYAANLLAVQRSIDGLPDESWDANIYAGWLDALRMLDDVPGKDKAFPEVMRSRTWQHKQLRTALASWAELRHDTLLYGKQSYTAYPSCDYPAAYVEPYPEFYARIRRVAGDLAKRLRAAEIQHPDVSIAQSLSLSRDRQVAFFEAFASTCERLQELARRELAGEPFSASEREFLKKTISMTGGGSGPPTYDGWYPKLIYGEPSKWKPVIADVHTDPQSQTVLEVGTGDAHFVVVAIDNEGDRAAYVGPVSSYYEFSAPAARRLTDDEWQQRIARGQLPAIPDWTRSFQAKPAARDLR